MRRMAAAILAVMAWLTAGPAVAQYKPSGEVKAAAVHVFGIHPYSNPQDLYEAYAPIARYLESKLPGSTFRIEASRDYADFEAKVAAGAFQFALPNPLQAVVALRQGYTVVAKMTPDDDFRGLIVARKDRKITSPRDLAGKAVAFPSATAVAGTLLPLSWLQDNGLDVTRELEIKYVGSQFSSLLNAYTGEVAACGSTVRFWRVWSRENPDKAAEMEVLWQTESLPHNAVIAHRDIDPAFAARVGQILAGMDKDPKLDMSQFKQDQAHFEAATDATYTRMSDFLAGYDQRIGLPAGIKSKLMGK